MYAGFRRNDLKGAGGIAISNILCKLCYGIYADVFDDKKVVGV